MSFIFKAVLLRAKRRDKMTLRNGRSYAPDLPESFLEDFSFSVSPKGMCGSIISRLKAPFFPPRNGGKQVLPHMNIGGMEDGTSEGMRMSIWKSFAMVVRSGKVLFWSRT